MPVKSFSPVSCWLLIQYELAVLILFGYISTKAARLRPEVTTLFTYLRHEVTHLSPPIIGGFYTSDLGKNITR